MRFRFACLALAVIVSSLPGCGGGSSSEGDAGEDAATRRDGSTSTAFDSGPAEPCATPGAIESVPCGECGQVERFCTAAREWTYGECVSPPSCTPIDEPCDTPGALETVACGSCGETERFCSIERVWEYGECTELGECAPGATRTRECGLCGSRVERCTSACAWDTSEACEGEGECSPGESRRVSDGCVPDQTRLETCDSACTYQPQGACEGPIVPTCPTDTTWCGDRCADLRSDEAHCGACDRPCQAGASCIGAVCECAAPRVPCGASATCVDTSTDSSHCGACGNRCPSGTTCVAGACACPSGQTLCNGACRDLRTDPNHCGGCGIRCLSGGTCSAGRCSGPQLSECLARPASFSSCNAYCASIGRTCALQCGGTGAGGAYGRYFDSSCTMINGVFGTCSGPIEGSSSIQGFRCCCVP